MLQSLNLKKFQTSKKKFESGSVGPGPFWIENWKKKIDDYVTEIGFQIYPNLFWMSGIFLTLQGPLFNLQTRKFEGEKTFKC